MPDQRSDEERLRDSEIAIVDALKLMMEVLVATEPVSVAARLAGAAETLPG